MHTFGIPANIAVATCTVAGGIDWNEAWPDALKTCDQAWEKDWKKITRSRMI